MGTVLFGCFGTFFGGFMRNKPVVLFLVISIMLASGCSSDSGTKSQNVSVTPSLTNLAATNTPEPTATNSPVPTVTDTPVPTATNTPVPTATNTPTPTVTSTPTPTPTQGIADRSALITIIDTENRLTEKGRERIREIAEKTYPEMWWYFNKWNPEPVTIEITRIEDNPAYTAGDGIFIDYEYANDHYEDLDLVTHELCHVVQGYTSDVPGWLVEGIADFGRNKFGLYNDQSGWRLGEPSEYDYYTDSYRTTAAFLNWINDNYGDDFVKSLNTLIQEDKYTLSVFEKLTGNDVDTLWELYLGSFGITIEKVDISLPATVPIPEGTDIGKYLTIVDRSGSASEKTINNLKHVFEATYGKICEEFNYGGLGYVTLTIDPDYGGVAEAYSDDTGNHIVLSSDYIAEYPEDYDCITHELVHVAQGYSGFVPGWLVEGMADLGRDMFGINNENASWRLPVMVRFEREALEGYRGSAAFLKWINETYGNDTVKKVNEVCKEGRYNNLVWKDITGKSLAALIAECCEYSGFKWTMEPGEYAGDLAFFKGDELVRLSAYSGKPTLLILGDWQEDVSGAETAHKFIKEFGDSMNAVIICVGDSAWQPENVDELLKRYLYFKIEHIDMVYDRADILWAFALKTEDGAGMGMPCYVVLDKDGLITFKNGAGSFFTDVEQEELDRNAEWYAFRTMRELVVDNQ